MKKALSLAALALSLAACGPKTEKTMDTATNSASDALAAAESATSNVVEATKEAVTPTPSGQEFADKAAKSDAFEIAAAKLAMNNAAAKNVKSLAEEMTQAHKESTTKIKAAASEAEPAIRPDATLTDAQTGKLADLGKLKGTDFDKKYISGQIDAHQDALSLMEDYSKTGDVASLRTAASQIAPIVQKHLDMAKALKQ